MPFDSSVGEILTLGIKNVQNMLEDRPINTLISLAASASGTIKIAEGSI